jgi:carbon starvation protein CstA
MAAPPPERTRRSSETQTAPDENTRILWFNVAFFGTLAWLSSSARVSDTGDWWHRFGQIPLMVAGLVLFWIAWWHLDKGRDRQALSLAGPATVILSVWITSVHGAAL